jgi:hypothetical protein
MVVTAINIPIGATVAGLWVASRLAGEGGISMSAVGAFVLVAGACALALTVLLGRLGARHDALHGRKPALRRHVAWLRPMSGERLETDSDRRAGALDIVAVVVVVATILAFEYWFLFLSGSPFDQRSGRH